MLMVLWGPRKYITFRRALSKQSLVPWFGIAFDTHSSWGWPVVLVQLLDKVSEKRFSLSLLAASPNTLSARQLAAKTVTYRRAFSNG
jgi:hypothetical protein